MSAAPNVICTKKDTVQRNCRCPFTHKTPITTEVFLPVLYELVYAAVVGNHMCLAT
jgi:hypothetical protein